MKVKIIKLSAIKVGDPERAILPCLVYTKMYSKDFSVCGRMISVGWWAWGIGLAFIRN